MQAPVVLARCHPRRGAAPRPRGQIVQELAMLAPACLLTLMFLVAPFAYSFLLSLTNTRLVPRPVPVAFVGLGNYARVLGDPLFWQALWNVTRFALMVLPLQCGTALLVALLLNTKLPFRNLLRGIFFLPAITSMVVVCVIWATLFQYPHGTFNTFIAWASFGYAAPIDWLGNPQSSMPALAMLSAWHAFGFQMIIYLAGLQNIPVELYEVARIDGADVFRRFWYVTMPSLRDTHVFVIVVTTIGAFKLFTQVDLLTGGGPSGSTETIVHYMVAAGFTQQRVGYGSAVAVLLFIIITIISVGQRLLIGKRR